MSAATLSLKFFLLMLLFQLFQAQSCTSGTYLDTTTNSCQPCDSSCSTCNGATAANCTACNYGILYAGTCYPPCDTSMYFNTSFLGCDVCSPSCSECTGPTASDCTTCNPPNTLVNGVCKCQTGQYLDVNGICQTCNTFCSDCDGALSTNCLACYNNMVLSAGQCVCPENSAMDITGKKCVACSDSCAQCSTTTPATCQVCQNNLTLSATGECTCTGNTYLDNTTYTCQSCPTGTFFSNGACTSCDATCATCSGSGTSACLTCPSGMTLSASNTCTCNAGTYWDSTSSSCKACNGSCQACTGPLATDCSTCKTGLTKGSNGACGCTGSTFLDTTTYTCKACDATCATCSGSSATTCLTCPSGMTLSAASKTCTCNQGTYWNSSTFSCQACYGACKSCSGPLSSECSTCQSGLQKAADGTCGCASGSYLNTASFTCGTCNSGCNECSGPSANQCLSCPSGMQLSASKTCECPVGTYLDSTTKICKACQGSCQACTGPLDSDCSTCKTGLTKGANGICGCTGNTYLNTNTYTCESCSSTCNGCAGPSASQCSSCKSGLTVGEDGTCQCPISTYFNEQAGQCSACDSSCDYCSGPNPNDCSACPTGQILIGGVCSTCPSGTYITGTTCESCSTSCAECSGSSYDQCTSCNSGWTYNNGKCIQSCSQGQYNAQDGSCFACDSSCLECSGSGSNSCLSCAPGQVLTNGQCTAGTGITSSLCPEGLIFVEDQNTCLSQCPPSYYIGSRGSDPVCLAKVVIQNSVRTTSKIDQYRIVFNADITGIYAQLAAITSVTIELIAAQQPAIQYNTTLSLYSDSQSILITFDITGHLLPANAMLVTFNLPDDNRTTYTLLNNQLSSQMFEYYSYSSGTQNAITATSTMNEVGQRTNEVITWGTSFILQSIHSIRSELMESMIAYCIYMNITYPPNFVSYAMGNLNANDMFLPNVPWMPILNDLSAKNNVDDVDGYNSRLLQESGTMDDVGQGIGVKASDLRFLSDVGSSVTFLLIILILVGVFDLFVYILQRKKMQGKLIYKVTEYLNYHFKWSYLINEFISEYMGLTFAPLVALVYTKVFTPDVVFDYVFAVIIFSITIISMAGILYLVRYIHKLNHQRSDPAAIAAAVVTTGPERVVTDGILITAGAPIETSNPEDPASSHESSSQHGHNEAQKPILIRLNVLHIEYNNRTYLQLLYPFFLMLRCFGFSLVLALSQSSPIFQCIYLMLATLGIMVYIALIKPFRKRVQQILSLIYEGILFIVGALCLTLHIYTLHNILDIDTRSSIAFGIVAGALIMMIFNFVALFFEIVELLHHLKTTKVFHRLKNLKFWKKSMPVGPMEQLTRADTKQPLEETQHSHLNTQLTSSNSNLLKMGIRKSISIENYAKPIGSSKEISFTEEVNRTDEGTLTLNNIPTEPQVRANNDSSASIFKFYKYSMKDVDHEIKEDPEEVVNESFKREKEEPISSLNKLNGMEEYDAFNCSSIDKLDSIIRKERESENSLKGHGADSKISLPGSGNDTLKEGLQQEDLEVQHQEHEVGKSKFKPKKSRSKSKEKTKGHKRSLNSIAAIFGFTYTDVSGKSVISKVTPNKSSSKKIAPFPKRVDWSSEMVSQGDTGRQVEQIEEKNFSRQDEEKENEYTRTVMSAREEKNSTWNNTLDMKIMLNSARNNELQYFNNQTSSQKDSEDNTMDKFIRVQPFESLESLPLDKDESSVEYQASKEDIQDTNQTPTKEKLRHKVFNMQMKKLRSMKSMKSMKSIDETENDEEPKVNTEQSDIIVVQDEGNRSRQRAARPLGRKREEGSLDRIERKKQGQLKGRAERKFSLNAKKE